MNVEIKKRWVEALRSGEYQQARKQLRSNDLKGFCCLGVLCDLHAKETKREWATRDRATTNSIEPEYLGESARLPDEVVEWAGLGGEVAHDPTVTIDGFDAALSDHNDGRRDRVTQRTFEEIAAAIEEQL